MPQAEQHAQAKAKENLKTFLLENEENKRLKEEAKEADRKDNIRYMVQQTEKMNKDEQVRLVLALSTHHTSLLLISIVDIA